MIFNLLLVRESLAEVENQAVEVEKKAVEAEAQAVEVKNQIPEVEKQIGEVSNPQNALVGPVTQAAVQAGVLSSASRINQVCNFLTGKNQSGAFLFLPNDQPDKKIFSASFEILEPQGATVYASASFATHPETGNAAVYDEVSYQEVKCLDLETTTFKDLKRVGLLKKNIIMMDAGAVKIFLMSAGNGCVIIKKEVVQ